VPRFVQYNFTAADHLSTALAQLSTKLSDLANLRANQKTTYLDDCWKGQKHDDFVTTFGGQQTTLGSFQQRALSLKGQVDQATADAHAALSDSSPANVY
jgi:hypothetical protein